jgi:hypothetical protein
MIRDAGTAARRIIALPDRVEDAAFRGLYEALLANAARRDSDIESIVLRLEDVELSALAVELFERGEAHSGCREPGDTSEGPLGRTLADALAALRAMDEEAELEARGRAAREDKTDDARALQAFNKARAGRQGFLPPAARRRGSPGT